MFALCCVVLGALIPELVVDTFCQAVPGECDLRPGKRTHNDCSDSICTRMQRGRARARVHDGSFDMQKSRK